MTGSCDGRNGWCKEIRSRELKLKPNPSNIITINEPPQLKLRPLRPSFSCRGGLFMWSSLFAPIRNLCPWNRSSLDRAGREYFDMVCPHFDIVSSTETKALCLFLFLCWSQVERKNKCDFDEDVTSLRVCPEYSPFVRSWPHALARGQRPRLRTTLLAPQTRLSVSQMYGQYACWRAMLHGHI